MTFEEFIKSTVKSEKYNKTIHFILDGDHISLEDGIYTFPFDLQKSTYKEAEADAYQVLAKLTVEFHYDILKVKGVL